MEVTATDCAHSGACAVTPAATRPAARVRTKNFDLMRSSLATMEHGNPPIIRVSVCENNPLLAVEIPARSASNPGGLRLQLVQDVARPAGWRKPVLPLHPPGSFQKVAHRHVEEIALHTD